MSALKIERLNIKKKKKKNRMRIKILRFMEKHMQHGLWRLGEWSNGKFTLQIFSSI
jgi:hypothetical protein